MSVRISLDDLSAPAVVAFLSAHEAQLREISPPESCHTLDLAGLRRTDVRFWVARLGEEVVGCAGLKDLGAGHAELKSMRTASYRTGQGIGTRLVEHVLDFAASSGVLRVSLETGSEEFFAPARRLYARHGFVECAPFGSYVEDPLSVFMSRAV